MSDNDGGTVSTEDVRVRRAPKYSTFIILGGALGAVVTLVLTMLQPADPSVGYPALFGYFLLYGVPAGVAVGAIVALVIDRISIRRAKLVHAEVTTVEGPPVEGELE
jgi:hypothetical protein